MNKTKTIGFFLNPQFWLLVVFALIAAWEVYALYGVFTDNIAVHTAESPFGNIVRLDMNSYTNTLQLLDSDKIFSPPPLNLFNPNPFK